MALNPQKIKKDFPIFKNYPGLIYLDNASTSQKPKQVINAVAGFYETSNSNVHRGIYTLADKATSVFENSRANVAKFIGAKVKEIIFTSNASEAINLVAIGYADKFLKRGDVIVTSSMEHHSNFVPWLRLKQKGIKLIILPINSDYRLDYGKITSDENSVKRIKLVALTHASNVLGTVNPLREIISFFRKIGAKNAKFLVDAAQSVPHLKVDVRKIGCDFLVFSSHKMLGPSGVGVLWAKEELLEEMDPVFVGSHMISRVSVKKADWAEIPDKFELGTGRLEGVAGLSAAISYLENIGMDNIENYEKDLTTYTLGILSEIKDIKIFGSPAIENRLGVFSFTVKGIPAHDIAEILNRDNIAVRAGHHCAQPLMDILKVAGTARASVYIYNTRKDIDKLSEAIDKAKKIFS